MVTQERIKEALDQSERKNEVVSESESFVKMDQRMLPMSYFYEQGSSQRSLVSEVVVEQKVTDAPVNSLMSGLNEPKDLLFTETPGARTPEPPESLRCCSNILKELFSKRHCQYAWPFYTPVDAVALGLPDYHHIIRKPMDLGTIKDKMDQQEYANAKDFCADVRLMFSNCYKYNPPSDDVVIMARKLEGVFEARFSKVPRDPESGLNEPKDLLFTETPGARTPEPPESLRCCSNILKELFSKRHCQYAWPFYTPVDAVALGLPDYHHIIRKPMDLGTIKDKMDQHEYANAKDFCADVRLMFSNCYKYNPPSDDVVIMARKLEEVFEARFSKVLQDPESGSISQQSISTGTGTGVGSLFASGDASTKEAELDKLTTTAKNSKSKLPPEKSANCSFSLLDTTTSTKCNEPSPSSPMTNHEKKQLKLDIDKMPGDKLEELVNIIYSRESSLHDSSLEEVEVDFETLQNSTLRALQIFVAATLKKCYKKANKGNVVKSSKGIKKNKSKDVMNLRGVLRKYLQHGKQKPNVFKRMMNKMKDQRKKVMKKMMDSENVIRVCGNGPHRLLAPPDCPAPFSPSITFDLAAITFKEPVLSPLKDSPTSSSKGESHGTRVHGVNAESEPASDEKPQSPKKDIVLKNTKSWAKLMEESIVSSPIKSSKDVFQYFRKAALEKEQREKMLQKKRLEEQREKEREHMNTSVPGLRESQPNISWTPDDVYGHRHEQQTSAQQKHSSTMRSVSEEREMEKRKEQERRRKYAWCCE
ncbi:bromodomain testis-specific protein isoform X3 [Gouania willdenowi]|uniref:bromodomain testis-specific protein isoform X3 n=1 Tax=Gouania willdenowi TaxID=441366 RepID=UPI0010553499|nr:bromodomain-containing protein 4-like isoform X3 [Gouania willdenowi]